MFICCQSFLSVNCVFGIALINGVEVPAADEMVAISVESSVSSPAVPDKTTVPIGKPERSKLLSVPQVPLDDDILNVG